MFFKAESRKSFHTPGSLPIWVKGKESQELSLGQRSSDTMISQPFSPYWTESPSYFITYISLLLLTLSKSYLTGVFGYCIIKLRYSHSAKLPPAPPRSTIEMVFIFC